MHNEYRFVDRWFVRAPLDDTYEVVGDTVGYPTQAIFDFRPRVESPASRSSARS